MRRLSRLLFLACAALPLVAGCSRTPAALGVDDAYVRLPAVPGNPAAAYFRIEGGPAADRLLSVGSDMVARTEMHASMMQGGAMTMAPLSGVDIPAGGQVAFAPTGNHVMLFGVPASVTKGGNIPLTLRFRSGAVLGLAATAIAAGDTAPD